jgi:D-3-phosphoglycerate dehydrogenase / 2-oxoglutarate reductase
MKDGVRIINCARGELIDQAALWPRWSPAKWPAPAWMCSTPEPPAADDPILTAPNLLATPHIAGSTEEAQEIVGIRIVEQLVEYLTNGVAINAVNMPAITPEQYKAVGPFVELAERLGKFAAHVAKGNPASVKVIYQGRVAEMNTNLLRNAAVAGVLSRGLATRVNVVNALQLAGQRGVVVEEKRDTRAGQADQIGRVRDQRRHHLAVEGTVLFDRPRLSSIDGIAVETPLEGNLIYMRNYDVPGVIGHVGTVFGRNPSISRTSRWAAKSAPPPKANPSAPSPSSKSTAMSPVRFSTN